jgi:acyl-CoA reductase-like NAD-dependent aldehyde dehydrogenase
MATAASPRVFKNFINGEWLESRSGKAYENRNPANTDELVGIFVSSNEADVNAAVDAANEAYKSWRLMPAPKRAEICFAQRNCCCNIKKSFRRI